MNSKHLRLAALIGVMLLGSSALQARPSQANDLVFDHTWSPETGHTDVFYFDPITTPGTLDLHIHSADAELDGTEIDDTLFVANDTDYDAGDDGVIHTMLQLGGPHPVLGGGAGDTVWILPANYTELSPGYDRRSGVSTANGWSGMTLVLDAVDAPTSTARFAIWTVGSFGTPNIKLQSTGDTATPQTWPIGAPAHGHMNWGFTEPGRYEMSFTGRITGPSGTLTSAPHTLDFCVINEADADLATIESVCGPVETSLSISGLEDGYFPGDTAALTAVQDPATGLDDYEWLIRAAGASDFAAVPDEVEATYDFTVEASHDGAQIKAVLYDGDHDPVAESAPVTIQVDGLAEFDHEWTPITGHTDAFFFDPLTTPGTLDLYVHSNAPQLDGVEIDDTLFVVNDTLVNEFDTPARTMYQLEGPHPVLGGVAGDTVWFLPADFAEFSPGYDRISGANDPEWSDMTLVLNSVDAPSPTAKFAIWEQISAVRFLSTGDTTAPQTWNTGEPAHGHMHWGFTEPGHYVMSWTGMITGPGGTLTSEPHTMHVLVTSDEANHDPFIDDVADQTSSENTPTDSIAFIVSDVETPAEDLVVTASSSNTALVPNENIVLGGSGENRTVTVTPAANQTGTTTITLTVTDAGGLTATDTYTLTVNATPVPISITGVAASYNLGDTLNATVVGWTLDPNAAAFGQRLRWLIRPIGTTGVGTTLLTAPAGTYTYSKVVGVDEIGHELSVTVRNCTNTSCSQGTVVAQTPWVPLQVVPDAGVAPVLTVTSGNPAEFYPGDTFRLEASQLNLAANETAQWVRRNTGTPWQTSFPSSVGATTGPTWLEATANLGLSQWGEVAIRVLRDGVPVRQSQAFTATRKNFELQVSGYQALYLEGTTLDLSATIFPVRASDANYIYKWELTKGGTTVVLAEGVGTPPRLQQVLSVAGHDQGSLALTVYKPGFNAPSGFAPYVAKSGALTIHVTNDPNTEQFFIGALAGHYHQGDTVNFNLTVWPAPLPSDQILWEWKWTGTEWAPFPGVSGTSHSLTAEQGLDGVQVRATLDFADPTRASVVAEPVTIHLDDHGAAARQQPTVGGNTSVAEGEPVTLTRLLPANGPTILTTHRWERKAPGAPEFSPIAGQTGDTLSFTAALADNGAEYRVSILKPDGQVAYGPSPATALTVNAGNAAPTISDVANQTTAVNTATGAIALTVGDTETAAASLVVTASSSNTALVPNENIVLGGSGENRTVTVTPAASQTGTTTITLTVTDAGGLTAVDVFVLTVNPVDDGPLVWTPETGHADVFFFDPLTTPGTLDLYIHSDDAPELEGAAIDDVLFVANDTLFSEFDPPHRTMFELSEPHHVLGGSAGDTMWVLPQDFTNHSPGYDRVASVEIPGWTDMTLVLDSVDAPTPTARFAIWQDESTVKFLATGDTTTPQTWNIGLPMHGHMSWGFTEPGLYELSFRGQITGPDGTLTSAPHTLDFCVIGEEGADPATIESVCAPDDDAEPADAAQTIIVALPADAGALVVSVDPDDDTVVMSELALSTAGDRYESSGELRPVTVTDTRSAAPGWTVSGQVSVFTAEGATFAGSYLGWAPHLVSQGDSQGVTVGDDVAPGFPAGDGLSVASALAYAAAGAGTGTAVLSADLALEVPTDIAPGEYSAVLTLTVI